MYFLTLFAKQRLELFNLEVDVRDLAILSA